MTKRNKTTQSGDQWVRRPVATTITFLRHLLSGFFFFFLIFADDHDANRCVLVRY